jgi:hypothetical protein
MDGLRTCRRRLTSSSGRCMGQHRECSSTRCTCLGQSRRGLCGSPTVQVLTSTMNAVMKNTGSAWDFRSRASGQRPRRGCWSTRRKAKVVCATCHCRVPLLVAQVLWPDMLPFCSRVRSASSSIGELQPTPRKSPLTQRKTISGGPAYCVVHDGHMPLSINSHIVATTTPGSRLFGIGKCNSSPTCATMPTRATRP